MTRDEYLQKVIDLYLEAPDTPQRARRADWAIASTFHQRGVDLGQLAHVIRLASLRRHRRAADLDDLEPICSLAYFRPLLERLQRQPHDPGYVEYIRWSFQNMAKTAEQRQITAVSDRR